MFAKQGGIMTYKTQGVCSRQIDFDVVDGKLHNVRYVGGCNGKIGRAHV